MLPTSSLGQKTLGCILPRSSEGPQGTEPQLLLWIPCKEVGCGLWKVRGHEDDALVMAVAL